MIFFAAKKRNEHIIDLLLCDLALIRRVRLVRGHPDMLPVTYRKCNTTGMLVQRSFHPSLLSPFSSSPTNRPSGNNSFNLRWSRSEFPDGGRCTCVIAVNRRAALLDRCLVADHHQSSRRDGSVDLISWCCCHRRL
jgi:hypothetical protein